MDFNPIISNIRTQGLKTQVANIPTEGSATYSGRAFQGNIDNTLPKESNPIKEINKHTGILTYTVNFAAKTGSGKILGFGDQISLEQGDILGTGISSTVKQDGSQPGHYSLDFFGKNAEEIGGKVSFDGKDTVGFGGTRGEIQK
ncbi:Uncharacterised protein [uncultured Aggregatibacter sp.]|nr:Uncharacterised protein [uncultured Aggregatibacter sp.]